MKRNIKFVLVALVVLIAGISSCTKDENVQKEPENDVLKKYLEIKSMMSSFQNTNGNANLAALEANIIKNFKSTLKDGPNSGGADSGWVDSGWVDVDTTYWQEWTCANVSEYVDNDGNFVTVYDYGVEGCEDWGSLIKGKISYIWSQNQDVYYSKVIYENYSAWGMSMNGFSEYTYTVDNMIFNETDTARYMIDWSGSSSCTEDMEMSYEGGETFHYTANYSSEWSNNSYTVHQGEYSYKSITGNYVYKYTVTEDLFYNYECGWEIWVPVSGIEEIYYKDLEQETTFITKYGDGNCDNIAVVIENGIEYTIDFGNLWYSKPCEEANCDSVVVYADGTTTVSNIK